MSIINKYFGKISEIFCLETISQNSETMTRLIRRSSANLKLRRMRSFCRSLRIHCSSPN